MFSFQISAVWEIPEAFLTRAKYDSRFFLLLEKADFSLKLFSSSLKLSFWLNSNAVCTSGFTTAGLKAFSPKQQRVTVAAGSQTSMPLAGTGVWEDRHRRAGAVRTCSSGCARPGSVQILNYFRQGEQAASARSEQPQMKADAFRAWLTDWSTP